MKTATKTYRAFNLKPWEVQATLAGTLTELRRPCRDQTADSYQWVVDVEEYPVSTRKYTGWAKSNSKLPFWLPTKSPFGSVGDDLWGRETFKVTGVYPDNGQVQIEYKAGGRNHVDNFPHWGQYYEKPENGRWISTLKMPREFCRIYLEVKRQRVEQVQEVAANGMLVKELYANGVGMRVLFDGHAFKKRWDADNKKPEHKWAANPWEFTAEVGRVEG